MSQGRPDNAYPRIRVRNLVCMVVRRLVGVVGALIVVQPVGGIFIGGHYEVGSTVEVVE